MKNLNKFSDRNFKKYIEKYKDKPNKIAPFNPQTRKIAEQYTARIDKLLAGYEHQTLLMGAVAFGIAGKKDIDIGVYTDEKNWKYILNLIKEEFGDPEAEEKDFARFIIVDQRNSGYEVEIHVYKGYEGELEMKLTKFLKYNKKLTKELEKIKTNFAYSKKEYQWQKNKFYRKVIDQL